MIKEQMTLKYRAFENEINDIKKDFTIVKIDYDSLNYFAGVTYTDGYNVTSIIFEYIDQINFWSIKEIF